MPLNRNAALGAEVIELQQPFAAIGLEELLSRKFPPKEMLLAPWLPFKGVAMVFAPRGAGKTHFALGVAYAVASGGAYLGWHAPRPRKVLVIDGEMPAAALQERWMEIVAKNLKDHPQETLFAYSPPICRNLVSLICPPSRARMPFSPTSAMLS